MLNNFSEAPPLKAKNYLTLFNYLTIMRSRVFLFITMVVLLSSCEDNMLLRSEKKLKKDLQGTWLRSFQGLPPELYGVDCDGPNGPLPVINISEYWTFKDNRMVSYYVYESTPSCDRGAADSVWTDRNDTIFVSDFKVDAKIMRAFLKFQLISGAVIDSSGNNLFVDKWEFIELSDNVLYLAADNPVGGDVEQREFSRVK